MNRIQRLTPHRRDPSRASSASTTPSSSITRPLSHAELAVDVSPNNLPLPSETAPKAKEKRRPSNILVSGDTLPKQKPFRRGVSDSATALTRRTPGGMECGSDDARFHEAVSIGESLERGLEAFLPLLESVPPLFRSRGYHRRKNEFLNVKGILSGTVSTLKATQRGDVRIIAQQYLLFKDMIHDNLRSLLLWLDSEMERYTKAQEKGIDGLPSRPPVDAQAPCSPQPQSQPQPACQSIETVDSPIIKQISSPNLRSDKRHSVFSEVASSLTPILNSPLDVEMPPPVGDAADIVVVDGIVKYASLQALVTVLTSSKPNPNIKHLDQLHDTFLLCFRCFSTSTDVANALIARFQQPQPENLTEEQENTWRFHLQAIRLRVVDILRDWVDSYWVHEDDRQVAPLIQHFLESTIELRWSNTSKNIAQSLRRHFLMSNHPNMHFNARHLQATNSAALRVRFSERRPSSVNLLDTYAVKALPDPPQQKALKSATSVDVLARNEHDVHVLVFNSEKHCMELAHQLTLSMSIEFCKVDSEKLWHHLYRQCQDCDTEQTVKMLQLHALALQVWTTRSIVEQSDPETRLGVLTFFVALAFRFRKLRNFSALCAVYSGLTSGFMEKLSEESLPLRESTRSALQALCHLVQQARSDYELASDCRKPTVPPIEWFLEDFRSVIGGQHRASAPDMSKNALDIENYCKVSQTVRRMEKCHITYASLVVRASHIQTWISKSLFGASKQDLEESRAWVESRCDTIERRGPPSPKWCVPYFAFPSIGKGTAFTRMPAEITHSIPEPLPNSAPEAKPLVKDPS